MYWLQVRLEAKVSARTIGQRGIFVVLSGTHMGEVLGKCGCWAGKGSFPRERRERFDVYA